MKLPSHPEVLMIPQDYIDTLDDIYKDVLRAYVMFNPQGRRDEGVAIPSLYSGLYDKRYTLAQVRVACERMAEAGVVEIRDNIFVHPKPAGRELIAALTTGQTADATVPDFPPLPQETVDKT